MCPLLRKLKTGLDTPQRYLPLALFMAVPAVVQEFYVIDAETLLMGCFFMFLGCAVDLGGDAFTQMADDKVGGSVPLLLTNAWSLSIKVHHSCTWLNVLGYLISIDNCCCSKYLEHVARWLGVNMERWLFVFGTFCLLLLKYFRHDERFSEHFCVSVALITIYEN